MSSHPPPRPRATVEEVPDEDDISFLAGCSRANNSGPILDDILGDNSDHDDPEAELHSMSGSGVTYYNEELKMLLHLLKALPDTIPEGDLHDFRHYVLDPIKMKDIGSAKTVLSAKLHILTQS
ncbi:hypothetical protein B0H14DRAFT_3437842 [Mycena olivaceomarginata]|nr:hypothetical protein B0H14DRAFT_3437842 [Mycena olivaceomarginata]